MDYSVEFYGSTQDPDSQGYLQENATTQKSYGFDVYPIESLTIEALRQHNAEHTSTRQAAPYLPSQSFVFNNSAGDSISDTFDFAEYCQTPAEPYSYPRQKPEDYGSGKTQLENKYKDAESFHYGINYSTHHQYPMSVCMDNVDYQNCQVRPDVYSASRNEEPLQASTCRDNVLSGVGTWIVPQDVENGHHSSVSAAEVSEPFAG